MHTAHPLVTMDPKRLERYRRKSQEQDADRLERRIFWEEWST